MFVLLNEPIFHISMVELLQAEHWRQVFNDRDQFNQSKVSGISHAQRAGEAPSLRGQ
jgi:hypothetical protein